MNKVTRTFLLTLTLFAGMLSSCNANTNKTEQKDPMAANNWKEQPGLYAEIVTSKGNIVIALEYKKVPVTVANFVGLSEGKIDNTAKAKGTPFYDGLTFHRCIHTPQPFMIQGGDPAGNGSGGPGYKFGDEFDASLKFDKVGLLAMANAGPGTNGSQFFITEANTPHLDYKHTIFGTVVEGYPLVSQINNGEVIQKVNIVRVGADAQAFDATAVWAKKDELLAAKAQEFSGMKAQIEAEQKKQFSAQYKAYVDNIVAQNAGYQAEWDAKVKKQFPNAKKTASGLYYIIETPGTGPKVDAFKNAQVHYKGTLMNGNKFDASYDRGQPLPLMVGTGNVIPGWDEGLQLFNQGGKGKLIIPFYLAYGNEAKGDIIPAKSDLVFDVEIVSVQ